MSRPRVITRFVVAIGSLGACADMVYAQSTARQPNLSHGAAIAAQGAGPNVPGCAQCHAFSGASDGSGAFPRVAGQSADYIVGQLQAFASGARENAVMSPVAKGLSEGDAVDVAAYYAGQNPPPPSLPSVDALLFRRGEELATVGDEKKNIQACNNCHGPGGRGEPPSIPYLAGQYSHYTAFQLHMWKRGFRKTSPDEMAAVARRLDDRDIEAVAAYFQQVVSTAQASNKPKE
jgi:cytochrome c553